MQKTAAFGRPSFLGVAVPELGTEKTSTYRDFLRRVYFFKDLRDEEVESLAVLCTEESYEAGTILFTEGSTADKFYIVMEGRVEVWKGYGEIDRSLLAAHGPGHFFGEMALVDELPRSATLVARERSRVLTISREDFRSLIRSNSAMAISVMMSISLMVRSSNESFVEDLRERNAQLEAANRELKYAQAELLRNERLSTIGKFASLVMHDIRNPIAVLKAAVELAYLKVDDAEAMRSSLARMKTELLRMERLAAEVLDFSRGEIRLSLNVSSTDILFSRVAADLGERLSNAGIALVFENEAPGPLLLDEDRMARVLLNLADNSRKAMPNGGTLRLSAHRKGADIVFLVADTGEGMSEETLSHVFEPFFSASGRGGTGLGMLIVKNIVEAHEGDISIVSRVGAGTEVSVRIPSRL